MKEIKNEQIFQQNMNFIKNLFFKKNDKLVEKY